MISILLVEHNVIYSGNIGMLECCLYLPTWEVTLAKLGRLTELSFERENKALQLQTQCLIEQIAHTTLYLQTLIYLIIHAHVRVILL